MGEEYRADKYVSNNGPKGNGVSYEYDSKTGKWGRRYGNGSPYDKFDPDPDEKQPGYTPPDCPEPPPSGPSEYDKAMENVTDAIEGAFAEAGKATGKTMKGLLGLIVGIVAASTFANELAKNPDDIGNAVFKTGRTVACCVGLLLNTVVIFLFVVFFSGAESPAAQVVKTVVGILLICIDWGLIRTIIGKPFWIDFVAVYKKIRATKVPQYVYVIVELLVTALLTKPVLNFIDSFTVEWAKQNQDTVADSTVIILGIAMLAGSIFIAAVIGLIVCRLIKAVTAK